MTFSITAAFASASSPFIPHISFVHSSSWLEYALLFSTPLSGHARACVVRLHFAMRRSRSDLQQSSADGLATLAEDLQCRLEAVSGRTLLSLPRLVWLSGLSSSAL